MANSSRAKHFVKCATRSSALLILLFSFHHPVVFAGTRDDLRQRILAGEQISLSKSAPEDARTIDAAWIKEAVLKRVRIEIYRAVIQGRLDIHDLTIEQEFTLADCVVTDFADFSHATFKRDFFVSDAVFASGVFFQSTTFEHAATFQRTRFEGGPIAFDNSHFLGAFSAYAARFASKGGGTAVFTHARFDGNADFAFVVFAMDAHFITTQFGGQGSFPGARFDGRVDFSRAHFFDIATFGGGPRSNLTPSLSVRHFSTRRSSTPARFSMASLLRVMLVSSAPDSARSYNF